MFLVHWHKKANMFPICWHPLNNNFPVSTVLQVLHRYGIGYYKSCDVVPCWSTEGCNYDLSGTRYMLQANYILKHHVINNFTCLWQFKYKQDVFIRKEALNLVASLCNVMNNLLATYGVSNLYRSLVKAIL